MAYYQYIDPRELAEQLTNENIVVIDVRDDDFDEDGFIPNAINIPSEKWDNDELIDNLIATHEGKQKIIFHCKMSQVRGPSCATRYIERRDEIIATENSEKSKSEVMVLAGGYRRWKQLYAGTPGMITTNKG